VSHAGWVCKSVRFLLFGARKKGLTGTGTVGKFYTQINLPVLDNYDFSDGIRVKHAKRYGEETNLVRLDEDGATMFSRSEEVNSSLRSLGKFPRSHATCCGNEKVASAEYKLPLILLCRAP
jgi:hypothetical protein